jgi:hypothetical protein
MDGVLDKLSKKRGSVSEEYSQAKQEHEKKGKKTKKRKGVKFVEEKVIHFYKEDDSDSSDGEPQVISLIKCL